MVRAGVSAMETSVDGENVLPLESPRSSRQD
jgi:hypothetical protein